MPMPETKSNTQLTLGKNNNKGYPIHKWRHPLRVEEGDLQKGDVTP